MRNNNTKAFSAFDIDRRFNAHGVPTVFYLKKIKTGLYGEIEVYMYYNQIKGIRGTVKPTDREAAKRAVIKDVRERFPKDYPAGKDNIHFWR
jgi:hypothetical protein